MAKQATSRKKSRQTDANSATVKSGPQKAAPDESHIQAPRAERRAETNKNQRAERRRRYEKRQREWLLTKIGAGVIVVALLVGAGFATYNYVQDRRLNQMPDGVETFSYAGGDHSPQSGTPIEYPESPPVGGQHDPTWQNCAFYAAPIYNWHAVHTLEHGAVWLTYRPDLPQEQIDQLRELAEEQTYMLVSPYPDLQAPVVATAWNHQMELDSVDDERLDQFIRYFRQGPQAPEPNGICTGGTSATVS